MFLTEEDVLFRSRMFDAEVFISAVEDRPALYDLSNEEYRNRNTKIMLWEEVGEVMYSNWSNLNNKEKNEKGKFMMSKWKSLKDCFNRELREQKKQKSGDSAKNRKQYEYYKRLLFLLPNLPTKNRERSSNISKPQSVNENRNTPTGTKRKNNFDEDLLTLLKNKKTNEEENDSDRLFLLSLLSDMKKLPIHIKNSLKLQFLQAMNKATLGSEVGQNFSQFGGAGSSGYQANSNRGYTTQNDVLLQDSSGLNAGPSTNSTTDLDVYDISLTCL